MCSITFKKSLDFGEPRTVETEDLSKQEAVFLVLSCGRAEKQCVEAAMSWDVNEQQSKERIVDSSGSFFIY